MEKFLITCTAEKDQATGKWRSVVWVTLSEKYHVPYHTFQLYETELDAVRAAQEAAKSAVITNPDGSKAEVELKEIVKKDLS